MHHCYIATIFIWILMLFARACPNDELCLACDADSANSFCFVCDRSYFNRKTGMCDSILNLSDPHCLTYTLEEGLTLCQECEFRYRLTKAHTCTPCKVDNCAICDKDDRCWACFSGDKVNEEKYDCSSKDKCPIANCKICELSAGHLGCALCEFGYSISDLDKRECVPSHAGCLLVDADRPERCLECLSGYYISSNGTCSLRNGGSSWGWLIWLIISLMVAGGLAIYLIRRRSKSAELNEYPLIE